MCSDSYPIPILSLFFLYHPYIPYFLIQRIFHFLVMHKLYHNVCVLSISGKTIWLLYVCVCVCARVCTCMTIAVRLKGSLYVHACHVCSDMYKNKTRIMHTDAEHLTRQAYSCLHAHPHSHTYMHVQSAIIACVILGLNIVLCEHAVR